jgi:hypothetical protein
MPKITTTGVVADYSADGWGEFKKWLDGTYAKLRYVYADEGAAYLIVATDGSLTRACSINKGDDSAEFEASYLAGANLAQVAKNDDNTALTAVEPRLGTEVIYATHNYSDPTTWFGDSVRVEDEAATDDGDGLSWSLAIDMLIDLTHGKIFDEDAYILDQQAANPGSPHGYAIVVTANGVVKTQRAPFALSGGDYTVDYTAGKIVFSASQAGNTVLVSYSYENGSTFYIVPDAGTNIDIEKAKASWSDDFVMNDTVQFQVWGYAAVFAPQLGLPEGTKIPIQVTAYKTLAQLTAEAAGFAPFAIPAVGGASRGLAQPQHVVEFRYGTLRRLLSAYGIELRVKLENDVPMGGDVTTATFYCVVRSAA